MAVRCVLYLHTRFEKITFIMQYELSCCCHVTKKQTWETIWYEYDTWQ